MAIGPREGVLLGANLGRAIVTNGDFMAHVCDSAANRPPSQITLDRLVTVCLRVSVVFSCLFWLRVAVQLIAWKDSSTK